MLSVTLGIGDQMVKDALNVLFLSPEVVPFAKSGGLADVAGSLPIALKRLGLDIRLVLPFLSNHPGWELRSSTGC